MKKALILIAALIVLGLAYWLISPLWRVKTLDETLPAPESMAIETKVLSSAVLLPDAHEVSGEVLIVESGDEKFLRFENLETINGPDLRIYLSADLDVKDAIDLGPIRATEGNANYPLPSDIDLSKYKNALIWCRAFGVLFSYGEF